MSKKIAYSCNSCGAVHFKWSGKCSDCGEWNSLVEEFAEGGASYFSKITEEKLGKKGKSQGDQQINQVNLVDLNGDTADFPRIKTNISELDRVLGGGLVKASVVLIGGDPGIGKSTLLLQTAQSLAKNDCQIFYISGEESVDQVRLRAKRLGLIQEKIRLAATTNVNEIVSGLNIVGDKPAVVVIDSIQTMFVEGLSSAPGTVSQVRASAFELTIFAKKYGVTLLIVSHVTKDGQLAGPKVLEHMVDTVLYFEGEKDLNFRILRSIKNRFGAANEIGIFEMNESGLAEVTNPSELFLNNYESETSGTAIFAGMEGSRTILAEVQALVAPSFIPNPRRAVVGWDSNRLAMLVAVLNNRFGLNLFDKEIYLNVVGGLKIIETSADLAVACALISASRDINFQIPDAKTPVVNAVSSYQAKIVAIGEIGLTGEIRMIGNLESRLKEAQKLGFTDCNIPKANQKNKNFANISKSLSKINIHPVEHIRDLAKFFRKK